MSSLWQMHEQSALASKIRLAIATSLALRLAVLLAPLE